MGENRYVEVNNLEVGNYITIWDVDGEFGRQTVMAVDDLQYLPAADVRPVVHDRWEQVEFDDGYGPYYLYEHKKCGCVMARKRNYCPDCGAQMGGDAE